MAVQRGQPSSPSFRLKFALLLFCDQLAIGHVVIGDAVQAIACIYFIYGLVTTMQVSFFK